ncbi:MAG: hypothetical protein OEN50_21280, partial [Deltaproteobacteria bacterium]|nr:hypothetical protein [Deltaproteobacteria bacterium]
MRPIKRLGNEKWFLATAATLSGLSLLFCFNREKLLYAAEPAGKLTVTCVADRPVAHPGDRIAVTLWINGALG